MGAMLKLSDTTADTVVQAPPVQVQAPPIQAQADPVQSFALTGQLVERVVKPRNGEAVRKAVPNIPGPAAKGETEAPHRYLNGWLRESTRPVSTGADFRVVDLFSGCGGLSLGIDEAIRATGRNPVSALALDMNQDAIEVYRRNFNPEVSLADPITSVVDRAVGDPASPVESDFRAMAGFTDLLIGGPPCQGNSDLNNHTRRNDPRNELYFSLVRAAEILRPQYVIIENVPGVLRAKNRAVQRAAESLLGMGYEVESLVLNAHSFGSAQSRKRHFLVAARDVSELPTMGTVEERFGVPPQNILDAIHDVGLEPEKGVFGTSARHNSDNQARMEYLLANNIWELPNSLRPACHRDRAHSYTSVYGRMRPDQPAPTITSGFGSTGQGRFMHPYAPRTLTPHEAARVQGFPDWFSFDAVKYRRALQSMIGNAVPSQLGFALATEMIR